MGKKGGGGGVKVVEKGSLLNLESIAIEIFAITLTAAEIVEHCEL